MSAGATTAATGRRAPPEGIGSFPATWATERAAHDRARQVILGRMLQRTAADDEPSMHRATRPRILGVDVARAVAIVGMVAIHIGPQELPDGGIAGALYRSAHGRASVLFVLLAGVGVSLLAGDRSPARVERTRIQLAWRSLVLLPVGLALQELPVNVAVILQYYAVYFLVAQLALRWSNRQLLVGAVVSATLGPVLIVWLNGVVPEWFVPGVPAWTDGVRIARDIALTGFYPVAVWTAPLLVGMVIGRLDLRDPTTAVRLLAIGAGAAAVAFVTSDLAVAVLGSPTSGGDWRSLAVVVPHNEMPLWITSATAIATAALGATLALSRRWPRAAWPVAAFGQLAFTVYVVHLLVLAAWPEWLIRDTFGDAWWSLLRFSVVAVVLATAWRAVATRGPFEWLLRAPWQAHPTPTPTPTPTPSRHA